jgi:plasmid stabilization system protein ParE
MKLRFTRRATQDLAAIGDYIRSKNPDAAVRVRGAILETLRMLTRFPRAGRPQTVEGVRKIVTRRYASITALTTRHRRSSLIQFNILLAHARTAISNVAISR